MVLAKQLHTRVEAAEDAFERGKAKLCRSGLERCGAGYRGEAVVIY